MRNGVCFLSFFTFCTTFFLISGEYKAFAQNGVGVNTNTPKSSFEDNGSFGKKVTTVTASTTLDDTQSTVVCNNGGTAITVTLPAANTCSARIYEIKRNSTSTNTVTINVTSAGTIDGVASYLLTKAGQSVTIFSDGTVWQSRDGSGEGLNWSLTGNTGTTAGTNFLGTTDGVELVFKTNNSEKARLTSTTSAAATQIGYYGVGTATPITYGRISLLSNADGTGREDDLGIASFNTLPSPTVLFYSSRGTEASPVNLVAGDDVISIFGKIKTSSVTQPTLTTSIIRSNYVGNGTTNFSDMEFYTSNNRQLLIDSSGKVGVGTATPKSLLEINGSFAKLVTSTGTSNLTLTSAHSIIVCNNASTAIILTLPAASTCSGRIYDIKKDALSTAIVILSVSGGGNIDAATSLVLTAINTSAMIFSDGTEWKTLQGGKSLNGTAWSLLGNTGTDATANFIGTTDNTTVIFKTNGIERVEITNGGDVAIGNIAAQQKLSVSEGMNIDQSNTNTGTIVGGLRFGSFSGEGIASKRSAGGNQFGLDFYTESLSRVSIVGTGNAAARYGNVGINTTSPNARLHVVGMVGDPSNNLGTTDYAGTLLNNIATSVNTDGITKKGLEVTSIGAWGTVSTRNIGIHVSAVSGAAFNYDAIFNGGNNVGIATNVPKSRLEVNGSFAVNNTPANADITLDHTHFSLISSAAGTITVSLPNANTCANRIYIVVAAGAGAITLASPAGAPVNQFYNFTNTAVSGANIITSGTSRTFISDGTNWRRIQ